MTDFVLRPHSLTGLSDYVLRRVNVEPPIPGVTVTPGGPIGAVSPATPIKYGSLDLVGGGASYQEVAVRWTSVGEIVDEGGVIILSAQLSQAHPNAYISIAVIAEATAGPNTGVPGDVTITNPMQLPGFPPAIVFPPLQNFAQITVTAGMIAPAAGETFREVTIRLVVEDVIEWPYHNTINAISRPQYGPTSMVLRINDTTGSPPVPRWTWTGVQASPIETVVPEGYGIINVPVTLDQDALAPTVFNITSVDVDATALDYTILTPQVTIPDPVTGNLRLTRVRIQVLDQPNILVPQFRRVDITAAAVNPALALPATGGVATWRLSVEEQGTVVPTIGMAASAVSILEGGPAYLITGRVDNGPISGAIEIDIDFSGDASPGQDFSISWAYQVRRAQVLPGQQTFPICTVQAIDDGPGDPGEVAIFEIDAATIPSPYAASGSLTTTVSIVDSTQTSVTEASVMLVTGRARNMIQGLVAVNPPSSTLPVFMVDGERAQTVGFDRDGDGNWISAYVYAMVDQDTFSVPEPAPGSTAITLDLADGTETVPVDAFSALAQTAQQSIVFRLRPSDSATPANFERTPSNGAFGGLTGPSQTIGWAQVGADIVRETRHSGWLARVGSSLSDTLVRAGTLGPENRCGMIDLFTQVVQGMEMVICSGSLHNGATDWSEDFRDPAYTTRTSAGALNFRWFEVEIPAGWVPVLIDAHPGTTVAGQIIRYVADRSTLGGADPAFDCDHVMPTCGEYQFRFGMVRAGGAGNVSVAQCTAYLERRTIATWVGRYGVTTNPIFGDWHQYQFDIHRAGLQFNGASSANGWRRAHQVSDTILGLVVGARASWVAGEILTANGFKTRRLPDNPLAAASSWAHPWGDPELDAPGGIGVDGAQAMLPCAGWWRRSDIYRMGLVNRLRLKMQSPYDALLGGSGWWWNIAKPGSGAQAGQVVSVIHCVAETDPTLFRLPWHWSNLDPTPGSYEASLLSLYQRAPTSRPWNTWEVQQDPSESDLHSRTVWTTPAMTHISRVRNQTIDGWYGCREHTARTIHESVAAWATRIYVPGRHERNSGGVPQYLIKPFGFQVRHFGEISQFLTGTPRQGRFDLAAGFNGGSPTTRGTMANFRCEAWALNAVMSYYSTGTDRERALLSGGNPGVSGSVPFWSPFITVINHVMTDSGLIGRNYQAVTNGNPYGDAYHGQTDVVTKYGAWPDGGSDEGNASYSGPDSCTGQVMFQAWFMVNALALLRRSLPTGGGVPTPAATLLDRAFSLPAYIKASADAWSAQLGVAFTRGADYHNKFFIMSYGQTGAALSRLDVPVFTLAQVLAGDSHWRLGAAIFSNEGQHEKLLNALAEIFRIQGDLEVLNIASVLYDSPNYPSNPVAGGVISQANLNAMYHFIFDGPGDSWSHQMTGTGGGSPISSQYNGSASWWTPFLSWLQRLGAV